MYRVRTSATRIIPRQGFVAYPLLHSKASMSNAIQQCATEISQHFATVLPAADMPLLSSSLGTMASLGLAFNLVVCGSSHVQYTMDMVARDYLEDDVLYIICRYLLILSMITIFLQLYVEV